MTTIQSAIRSFVPPKGWVRVPPSTDNAVELAKYGVKCMEEHHHSQQEEQHDDDDEKKEGDDEDEDDE